MKLPVFAYDFNTHDLHQDVEEFGLVVVVQAKPAVKELRLGLEFLLDESDKPDIRAGSKCFVIHLSTEVDESGWWDYFIYTGAYDYDDPAQTESRVRSAVRGWWKLGSPSGRSLIKV